MADSNVTRNSILGFIDEYLTADDAVDTAVGERKDLRKRIKGAGIDLKAFDRMRRDSQRSGEERERDDREYRRYMAFIGKPVGTQTSFTFVDDEQEETEEEGSATQLRRLNAAEREGLKAGKDGQRADSNPWTPGSEEFARWSDAWQQGQAEKVAAMPGTGTGNGAAAPKKQGRPKGSKNRPRGAAASDSAKL